MAEEAVGTPLGESPLRLRLAVRIASIAAAPATLVVRGSRSSGTVSYPCRRPGMKAGLWARVGRTAHTRVEGAFTPRSGGQRGTHDAAVVSCRPVIVRVPSWFCGVPEKDPPNDMPPLGPVKKPEAIGMPPDRIGVVPEEVVSVPAVIVTVWPENVPDVIVTTPDGVVNVPETDNVLDDNGD
jgi:hypothetical protein